jgi:hypothetical protein
MAKPAKAAPKPAKAAPAPASQDRTADRAHQNMFALVVHASAAPDQKVYPAGERHTLIVMVLGRSPEDALTVAVEGMVAAGWRDHEVAQARELPPELDPSELGRLAASVQEAKKNGLCITVLSEPDK